MAIHLGPSRSYKFHWNCGFGSNTRAELLALWGILYCATWLGLGELTVFGDSKSIIDWVNMRGSLNSPILEPWKLRIRALISEFHSLSISHIYRIQNSEAYCLSKSGWSWVTDWISFQSFDNGILLGEGQIPI